MVMGKGGGCISEREETLYTCWRPFSLRPDTGSSVMGEEVRG